jgi:excisionase family DNA binding protein
MNTKPEKRAELEANLSLIWRGIAGLLIVACDEWEAFKAQLTEAAQASTQATSSGQPAPGQDSLLNVEQAAELLNAKKSTIYDRVRNNAIPHLRNGRSVRFDRAQLLQWAAEQAREQQRQKELSHQQSRRRNLKIA